MTTVLHRERFDAAAALRRKLFVPSKELLSVRQAMIDFERDEYQKLRQWLREFGHILIGERS